jgi:hypothetical protein
MFDPPHHLLALPISEAEGDSKTNHPIRAASTIFRQLL